jgi:hypothetical protein
MGRTIPTAKLESMRADGQGVPVKCCEVEFENVLIGNMGQLVDEGSVNSHPRRSAGRPKNAKCPAPSSLSDLGSSAAKIPWPVHISPLSRPIARYWHCEIVKIWPRPAIFFASTPSVRQATRDALGTAVCPSEFHFPAQTAERFLRELAVVLSCERPSGHLPDGGGALHAAGTREKCDLPERVKLFETIFVDSLGSNFGLVILRRNRFWHIHPGFGRQRRGLGAPVFDSIRVVRHSRENVVFPARLGPGGHANENANLRGLAFSFDTALGGPGRNRTTATRMFNLRAAPATTPSARRTKMLLPSGSTPPPPLCRN